MADAPAFNLAAHKKRAKLSWENRAAWKTLYDDAYEYAIPYRRPKTETGPGQQRVERVFDNTAIVSTFRFAGQLQQDLFPPGQPFFVLKPGPISKLALKQQPDGKEALTRALESVSEIVGAFFQTGEFDTAINEMCVDLAAGTAALLILEGDDRQPIRFVCLPFDEVAIEMSAYGSVAAVFWKTKMTRRAIRDAFPKGTFPKDFIASDESNLDSETDICQDFVYEPKAKRWLFAAYVDASEAPIATQRYRTQPVAVPRYYRVPGEAYGRGPILLALPTIKTLNKAMELMLKSAAIQMLGIWGYKAGSGFNPDTAPLRPGGFWAMQSTGGSFGADVQRLDTATGKLDVAELVTSELRQQVQQALHDDRMPDDGKTPRSAAEIMARLKRISTNYMGAYGRLVHEIIPPIVRRAIEIAYKRRLIERDIDIDSLLVKIDVLSPIAQALRADALAKIVEFMQLVTAIKGDPMALDLIVKVDDALVALADEMGIPSEFILTKKEREKMKKEIANAAAQLAAAQAAQAGAGQQGGGAMPAAA